MRSWLALAVFCSAALFASIASCPAADNRMILVSQMNWPANRGFFVDLENTRPGQSDLPLSSLKLVLGVAGGNGWIYLASIPHWTLNTDYRVEAVITTSKSTLSVSGAAAQSQNIKPVADQSPLIVGQAIDWASDPADYSLVDRAASLRNGAAAPTVYTLAKADANPASSCLVGQQPVIDKLWRYDASKTLTVDLTFRIIDRPGNIHFGAPIVDPYGQYTRARWPGKVGNDRQLASSIASEHRRMESMPRSKSVDRFGGDKTARWHVPATGFYRVIKRDGMYWLITPTGYPTFYTGMSGAPIDLSAATPVTGRQDLFEQLPPRNGPLAGCWQKSFWGEPGDTEYVAFGRENLIRKFGPDWEAANVRTMTERLSAWGFIGEGKWSKPAGGLPFIAVLERGNRTGTGLQAAVPILYGKPDIFDPTVQDAFRKSLAAQMQAHLTDPDLIGWSLGNELDEIVMSGDIAALLADAHPSPAKKALVDQALQQFYNGDMARMAIEWKAPAPTAQTAEGKSGTTSAPGSGGLAACPLTVPAGQLESLREFFEDRYYAFIYETVKSIDPNHLFLGHWIVPGWWQDESDWRLLAAHCDVLGYDRYADRFSDPIFDILMKSVNKPVLCGEFGYPPTYNGQNGFGLFAPASAVDDADAGRRYAQWISDAAKNPYCIGGCWFMYRDEPITGRGPGCGKDPVIGERFAFGAVDVTDQPKWPLVLAMRSANMSAVMLRLEASKSSCAVRPHK